MARIPARDVARSASLILLSIVFLPISILVLGLGYSRNLLTPTKQPSPSRLPHEPEHHHTSGSNGGHHRRSSSILSSHSISIGGSPINAPHSQHHQQHQHQQHQQEQQHQQREHEHEHDQQRTILVTGVGMAKGLALARAFRACGHRVIGADFEDRLELPFSFPPLPFTGKRQANGNGGSGSGSDGEGSGDSRRRRRGITIPSPGRFSNSLSAFSTLPRPDAASGPEAYIAALGAIVREQGVDLWVSCSGVASAVEDALAKEALESYSDEEVGCACIQFDRATTEALHDKAAFMAVVRDLGLTAPETHVVRSVDDVMGRLGDAQGETEQKDERGMSRGEKMFILKPVGVDDAHRGVMTLLPLGPGPGLSHSSGANQQQVPRTTTTAEKDAQQQQQQTWEEPTRAYVSRLPISSTNPWILQQFIPGGQEYCTNALVVRGQVRCFVACPSADMLMHYKALPPSSVLSQDMLKFTQEFVRRYGDRTKDVDGDGGGGGGGGREKLTGHLSFDFMLEEKSGELFAIECNPRAHTAVVLFSNPESREMGRMVEAYVSATEDTAKSGVASPWATEVAIVRPPLGTRPRYWIAHDLVSLMLHRVTRMFSGKESVKEAVAGALQLRDHVRSWKEGTMDASDPLPGLVLYHVYWPMILLAALFQGNRWSRINVSTTKMFMC